MFGALCETVSNIFFDYGFIYGHFGLPQLGFNGAAYASVIAEGTGMLVVLSVIHLTDIRKRFKLYESFSLKLVTARLILVQSSPLMFQYAISIVSWNIFYILIEHHGPRALAISNTMRNIFGLFGVFTWAFASTTNTMVSNIIGQGLKEKVPALIVRIMKLSMATGIFFCLLINLFPTLFLSVFGQDALFTREALPVVRVVSSALVVMSFSNIWLNAITGTGNTKVNLLIECVTIFLYLAYVYLVLEVFNLPIVYGWMSEWLYWTSIFLMSWGYMRSGKWKQKII